MTLLITVLTRDTIHLSSDFRLSHNGVPLETENGAKQLSVSGRDWMAQVAFTGIARDGAGYDTGTWIRDVAMALPADASLDLLLDGLAARGTQALASVVSYDNRLTLVVAAMVRNAPRLVICSNWEPQPIHDTLESRILRRTEVSNTRPTVLAYGFANALPRATRRLLRNRALSGAPTSEIQALLAKANVAAARVSRGAVSYGCWVQSLTSTGDSSGRNYGLVPGTPSRIMGTFDMGRYIANELPAALGKKLTLVQSAGYQGPGTPAPTEVGEPRQLAFSTPKAQASLICPSTGVRVGVLAALGASGEHVVQKNKYSSASFGKLELTLDAEALRQCPPFLVKRLRLPCLPIVAGANPRTWDYTFDMQFDGTTLTVNVLQNSMSFRSANCATPLPILQGNEELVMVAPVGGLTLSGPLDRTRSDVDLEAQFLLRDFPELQPRPRAP